MTTPLGLPELAALVKGWQTRIDAVTATIAQSNDNRRPLERRVLRTISSEMHLFAEAIELSQRIDTLEAKRLPVTTLPLTTAPSKCPCGARQTAFRHSPSCPEHVADDNEPKRTTGGMEVRQCRQRRDHAPHYWRDLQMFACDGLSNKFPPMVPEEV